MNNVTPEQMDAIVDAFATKSDVDHVCITTGLPEKVVRDALSSPETALYAMRRKAAVRSVWLYGTVFDILDDMVREGSAREQIQGIKLYREFLKDLPKAPAAIKEPEEQKLLPPVDSDEPEIIDVEPLDEEPLSEEARIEDLLD
jgi:hypothetical protein